MSGLETKKVSDHEMMKRRNHLIVLRQVRENGPITRVELQKRTKLSWGTITSSIKELLRRGIIEEIGSVTTGVGRRPVELDMNARRNFVLGIDLGTSFVRSVLVDVKGRIVGESEVAADPAGTREQILDSLRREARQTLARHAVADDRLAGIGIAAPGAVDFRNGICHYAPHHPNWRDVALKDLFEREFAVPCFVDHVSNCFALSEKLFGGGQGLDSFVGVLLGTGVSAGIVIHGEVYRGAENFSGEFGHTCVDPNGPRCACGNTGCLEAYVSGSALAGFGAEAAARDPGGLLRAMAGGDPRRVTGEVLDQAARRGDPMAREIFERMGVTLGVGVSNLINLLNPQRIILGGQVSKAGEHFLPSLQRVVEERAWHGSTRDIRISRLEKGSLLGAAALVLQELFVNGYIVR